MTARTEVYIDKKNIKKDTLNSKKDKIRSKQEMYKRNMVNRYMLLDSTKNDKKEYIGSPSIYKESLRYDYDSRRFYQETNLSDSYKLSAYKVYSLEEYVKYQNKKSLTDYWRDKSAEDAGINNHSGLIPELNFGGKLFDAIFGSDKIVIKPQGSFEVTLGVKNSNVENPAIPESLRSNTMLDFGMRIQMNVSGSIGDRLKLDFNYNTDATFDFQNNIKVSYDGKEDDIIQEIEAGNVSLPLSGTLINGGQNLFGFKTKMKFGKLGITTLISQQKGETKVMNLENGAQKKKFNIKVVNYEANRHFFLSRYFVDNYDKALERLPLVNSKVIINKIEVWVTNKNSNFLKARNIVAFTDLGEPRKYILPENISKSSPFLSSELPSNEENAVYEKMLVKDIRVISRVSNKLANYYTTNKDYEKIENARMLSASEYTLNDKLGYISLNRALNSDEVLAVAYEYTSRDGTVHRVGELTSDAQAAPNALFLKLLKGTNLNPKMPHWPLMMKNIYNLGAYGASVDDFNLNVMYRDDKIGTNLNYLSLPASEIKLNGKILLSVMNLDRLNKQLDVKPDGAFDYIEGLTISSERGRIIFPVLEPFGSKLKSMFMNKVLADRYVFNELYEMTKSEASLLAEKNKFTLEGSFKSEQNSEISLNNSNIKPGAVKVIAGSRELVENIDYTVNYAMGKVKIINQGILESGTPISISSESNNLLSMQTKTLIGTHLDYKISDNLAFGASVLHLSESPLTRKVNIGNEPISNTIWGVNGSYSFDSGFLTKMVDAIPFIDTKAKSKITVDAEFAQFLPGHNGDVGSAYIDDFEGSKMMISLRAPYSWKLASTPEIDSHVNSLTDLSSGYYRAKIAWYTVDPMFYRTEDSSMPSNIRNNPDLRSNHYTREIKQSELFPNKDLAIGDANIISALNVAYYPQERGQYNFNAKDLNTDGSMKNPEKHWAGIMRKMQSTDFEAANIQYIEFWVMDPFIYNKNHEGGELCFDLGEVSEDILRDSRKSFENGLPTSADYDKSRLEITQWGHIPAIQSLVDGFDNNANSRRFQDVGLDGLSSEAERKFANYAAFLEEIRIKHGIVSDAYVKAVKDPSADDYHYFRGTDYDEKNLDVATRYKNYNNLEGNSQTTEMSTESYSTSATLKPDKEDINEDNTLNETESFYRYKLKIKPSEMDISNKYISDIRNVNVELENGTTAKDVKWYQFKIPISDYSKKTGNIDGFKSIRFMRMVLKDFKEEVNFRFASFGLIRDSWRMQEDALNVETNIEESGNHGKLEVSSVSIEENSGKTPVNYILPPDISRSLDASYSQYTQMNEQAMLLKFSELEDGYSRQVYKNVTFDMLRYKRLVMDVHAEELNDNTSTSDSDLRLFIRIGSDYKNNYYEYELPLYLTPAQYYADTEDNRKIVWPSLNKIDIPLEYFQKIKMARNAARRAGKFISGLRNKYSKSVSSFSNASDINDDYKLVSIVGNPTIAEVKSIMIGVKNPKQKNDDGQSKSVEVWVNELRLSEFDESGGWAANVRLNARLADFANITLAGRKITPGFGALDQKISQLSRTDQLQYDLSTNVQLGKFFPDKWKMRIPMYYSISSNTILPEYDPVDTDLKLSDKLNRFSGSQRDSVRRNAETFVGRKSINFTNVGVENSGESKIIDISNLSMSYSYNEINKRDLKTKRDLEKNYRGGIAYTYNGSREPLMPFKNIGFLKSPYLKFIREFNFYYLPSQFSLRTDMERSYHEIEGRNLDNPLLKIEPSFDKDFSWNRFYDLRFDLSKSLSFNFSASSISKIDETQGMVDYERDRDSYKRWRDTVIDNIMDGGRSMQYAHNFTVAYKIPINYFPAFSWINATARYSGSYNWQVSPVISDDIDIGNEIRNMGSKQLNTRFNLLSLYNKSSMLKKINDKYRGRKSRKNRKRVKYSTTLKNLKKRRHYDISHNLKTKNLKIRIYDTNHQRVNFKSVIRNKNTIRITTLNNVDVAKVSISGVVDEKKSILTESTSFLARLMMSVRNVSVNYTETNNTTLPGYLPSAGLLGIDNYNNFSAPGFDFLIGNTDQSFGMRAAEKGWITTSDAFNSSFLNTVSKVFSGRASVELIRDLKINLIVKRSYSQDNSQRIVYDNGAFSANSNINSGRFSMTYLSFNSSIFNISNGTKASEGVYNDFMKNRHAESERLAKSKWGNDYEAHKHVIDAGFYEGYGANSQDVLIPAFFDAYGFGNSKDLFPNLWAMLPNWNIKYTGLKRIPFIGKYFQSFSLSHSYTCIYNVGSYVSNSHFGSNTASPISNNFYPEYDVSAVSIQERFNPLINVNMVWKNSFTTRFEINRSRALSLSLTNSQLSELSSQEYVFGFGYRFKHLPFIIKQTEVKNNLNLRCDFSIKKNNSIIRKIQEEVSQLTSGQEVISLKLSADYTLNNMLNLRLYYDRIVNDPYVSLAFKTTNTNFGLSVRFTLLQ
ncbi:MAG: cell surface protein SprA [Marinifilaceae bacterium]